MIGKDPIAVIAGCDVNFSYQKLVYSANLIRNGAKFIVSDYDAYFVVDNIKCPASAFAYYPIQILSKVEPIIICKPSKFALDLLMERDKIPISSKPRILMIGDSLETDIQFGKNAGIDTLLVLSGVTKFECLEKSTIKPDLIIDKIMLKK